MLDRKISIFFAFDIKRTLEYKNSLRFPDYRVKKKRWITAYLASASPSSSRVSAIIFYRAILKHKVSSEFSLTRENEKVTPSWEK